MMAAGTPGRNTPPPVKSVGQMANHPIKYMWLAKPIAPGISVVFKDS
jgi:hypothetical protein